MLPCWGHFWANFNRDLCPASQTFLHTGTRTFFQLGSHVTIVCLYKGALIHNSGSGVKLY